MRPPFEPYPVGARVPPPGAAQPAPRRPVTRSWVEDKLATPAAASDLPARWPPRAVDEIPESLTVQHRAERCIGLAYNFVGSLGRTLRPDSSRLMMKLIRELQILAK